MINYLMIVVGILLSWLGVFLLVPMMLRSISRHRMWEIRDQIADDILHEKIAKSDAAYALLDQIESRIKYAHRLKLWTIWCFPNPPQELTYEFDRRMQEQLKNITDHDREILIEHHWLMAKITFMHVALTSPFGWMISSVSLVWGLYDAIRKGWKAAKDLLIQRFDKRTKSRIELAVAGMSNEQDSGLETCVS